MLRPEGELFVASLLLSFVAQAAVIWWVHRYHLLMDWHTADKPQRFHDEPTPRAGGVGVVVGLLPFFVTSWGRMVALGALLAFVSGAVEDFYQRISPLRRLGLQLVAALAAVAGAHAVVTYLGLGITLPYAVGVLFSAFAIVGFMNAVNFIDGMNGLAAGTVLVILLSFGVTAWRMGDAQLLGMGAATAGATLGFLLWNFPAGRIFLGDGGAYLLGFLVALMGIFLAGRHESVSPWYVFAVLIYPVWEVIFSILRRKRSRQSAMHPDSDHLHTLIFRAWGRSHTVTTLTLLGMMAPVVGVATLYPHHSAVNMAAALTYILGYTLLYTLLKRRLAG